MRVLVTGAAGFVGLNLLAELACAGFEVVGLSRTLPDPGRSGWTRRDIEFVVCDVRDGEALAAHIATWRPTHIVHAAAVTPSYQIEREQARMVLEINQLSTLSVLTAAAQQAVARVLLVSSAGVYAPTPDATPLSEDASLRRDGSLYALTKIASEGLCRWAQTHLQLDARSVRVGPVYGPYERPTGSRLGMSLACRAVQLALAGEPLRCNNPDAIYDWIYARDTARGMLALLETPDLPCDVYNLAGPAVPMRSLLDVVATVVPSADIIQVDRECANLPVPATYRRAPLGIQALQRDTGYRWAYSLEAGIAEYVGWLRNATTRRSTTT